MNQKSNHFHFLKWILIAILIGILSGLASAFFLVALKWVTTLRDVNYWLIALLPLGGLLIGFLYHNYGLEVSKGNNLLLEEYENPQRIIPFKMAPLVLIGTLITHFLGGSAGREGTAVQMGGAIADQFNFFFRLENVERKILILLGIGSGFASVFGTPLAGTFFAIEVLCFGKINLKSAFLILLSAYVSHFTVVLLGVTHTNYPILVAPTINLTNLLYLLIVGIAFGLTAMIFSRSLKLWTQLFANFIRYAPLRPFFGGIILVFIIYFFGTTKYIGLGIPIIQESFVSANSWYDFILKIIFTGLTLGAGFKGGEVTPLFFIGATLGSALSLVIPLPIAVLSGIGFVAVFSGATHTPIACTVMGMELFGIEIGLFIGIACFVSYYFSGPIGIYNSQIVNGSKHKLYQFLKR